MSYPLGLDRVSMMSVNAPGADSSQCTDDSGHFYQETVNNERLEYPAFPAQVEDSCPSDRTVRYLETLSRNMSSSRLIFPYKGVFSGENIFLSAESIYPSSNTAIDRKADDQLQWRFRHWLLHAKWHYS